MHHPSFFTSEPPSIYQWVSSCLKGEGMPPYPYLPVICERSRLVVLVCIQSVAELVCFFLFLFQYNFLNYHTVKLTFFFHFVYSCEDFNKCRVHVITTIIRIQNSSITPLRKFPHAFEIHPSVAVSAVCCT